MPLCVVVGEGPEAGSVPPTSLRHRRTPAICFILVLKKSADLLSVKCFPSPTPWPVLQTPAPRQTPGVAPQLMSLAGWAWQCGDSPSGLAHLWEVTLASQAMPPGFWLRGREGKPLYLQLLNVHTDGPALAITARRCKHLKIGFLQVLHHWAFSWTPKHPGSYRMENYGMCGGDRPGVSSAL